MNTLMRSRKWAATAACVLATIGLAAQAPGRFSGNPTPGTPQPEPPDLANRITVVGCIRFAEPRGRGRVSAEKINEPSDSTLILIDAIRDDRVPPGTGTAEAAKKAASPNYRLAAINSALVPFVGSKVEISGELDSTAPPAGSAQSPRLIVEFVQRLSKACS